jgi:hypothetical protein
MFAFVAHTAFVIPLSRTNKLFPLIPPPPLKLTIGRSSSLRFCPLGGVMIV